MLKFFFSNKIRGRREKRSPGELPGDIEEEAKMLTQNKKSAFRKHKPLSSFNFNKHAVRTMSNIFLKKFQIF